MLSCAVLLMSAGLAHLDDARALIDEIPSMSEEDFRYDMFIELRDCTWSNKHPVYGMGSMLLRFPAKTKKTPITELEAMGARALPALLASLEDARPTKKKRSPGISDTGPGQDFFLSDNKNVWPLGPVCAYVVGLIVNRGYPSSEFDFDVSLTYEDVVPKIRKKWTGTTQSELIESYRQDILTRANLGHEQSALLRLMCFAPDQLVPTALKRMSQPVEHLSDYYTDYRYDHRGAARSPKFILPLEFKDELDALVTVEDSRIDDFCAERLKDTMKQDFSVDVRDNDWKFGGTDHIRFACIRRLMMHTRKYDRLLADCAQRLIESGREFLVRDGQWILKAIDDTNRFNWADARWFDLSWGIR